MAEVWNLCGRATSRCDGYINQILRATADVELLHGPDYRVTAIEVSYVNGYPHCSLTAACAAGDTTIAVNDCTGWAVSNYYGTYTGATGRVVDSGQQEAVHVTTASVTTGPGTLTLSSPLGYPHQAGTLVTTLPASIEQACIYFATAEALTRGATSTTIHAVGGAAQSSDSGARSLIEEGELLCHAFRRTI
jgi:hypothetical protein